MIGLSLRQPWAWLVVHGTRVTGQKLIENRVWNTHKRGERFLIHAAKGMTEIEYRHALDFVAMRFGEVAALEVPLPADLARGGFIGAATIDGVLRPGTVDQAALLANRSDVDVRWHMQEQYGFVLRDVRPTPFIPFAALQRFFKVPDDVAARVLGGAS